MEMKRILSVALPIKTDEESVQQSTQISRAGISEVADLMESYSPDSFNIKIMPEMVEEVVEHYLLNATPETEQELRNVLHGIESLIADLAQKGVIFEDKVQEFKSMLSDIYSIIDNPGDQLQPEKSWAWVGVHGFVALGTLRNLQEELKKLMPTGNVP